MAEDQGRVLGDLPNRLDDQTRFMSGGFHRLDVFQGIVAQGVAAIPELLENVERPSWPRLEAAWTIAAEAGKPMEFPEETRGRYAPVLGIVIDWAKEHDLIPDEPKPDI